MPDPGWLYTDAPPAVSDPLWLAMSNCTARYVCFACTASLPADAACAVSDPLWLAVPNCTASSVRVAGTAVPASHGYLSDDAGCTLSYAAAWLPDAASCVSSTDGARLPYAVAWLSHTAGDLSDSGLSNTTMSVGAYPVPERSRLSAANARMPDQSCRQAGKSSRRNRWSSSETRCPGRRQRRRRLTE